MVQPQLVVNESFKLQGPLEGDSSDALFEYYIGTSIFAAEQLLIKISKPDPDIFPGIKGYLQYLRTLYSIISPALLDFVEIGQSDDNRVFIVSENNNYQFLETFLQKKPQFLLEHICRYVIELGQAINAFHRQGLVYGGLDGKSIMVHTIENTIDEIKVQKAGYGPLLTSIFAKKQTDFSTLVYIAPEILNHNESIVQSDIYSLGIHLFTFLTGKYPIPKDGSPSQGPSLNFVAKALVRRSIPQELILLILKCLRADPLLRPANMIEVLTPLRLFIDERRKLAMKDEGVDPMAVLDALNMGKQRLNAQEVIRVLDTVDYFKTLAFSSKETHRTKSLQYPVSDFVNPEQVRETELQEACGPTDDPHMRAEDYLEAAINSIKQEEFSRLNTPDETDIRETYRVAPHLNVAASKKSSEKIDSINTMDQIEPIARQKLLVTSHGDASESDQSIGIEVGQEDAKDYRWKSYKVTPQEIIESLKRALSLAKKGRGTISIIEEPPQGPLALQLNRAIFQCREGSLYADIGALPVNASIQNIIMALLHALTPALITESKRSLQIIKRKVHSLGFSQLIQIEYALPGYHGIFFKDISRMDISIEQGIGLLSIFSRKRKPLFIVMRNIEHLGKDGNSFLLALRDAIPTLPIIFFGFFKSREVEDWHVLSYLK